MPFQALIDIYSPMHFSRIGLRYIDVIDKNALSLSGVPWAELIKPPLSGLLDSSVSQGVMLYESRSDIKLADDAGLVRVRVKFSQEQEDVEGSLTIDSDFFITSDVATDDALRHLDYFNKRAYRLFRWAITDRLHQAMGPSSL